MATARVVTVTMFLGIFRCSSIRKYVYQSSVCNFAGDQLRVISKQFHKYSKTEMDDPDSSTEFRAVFFELVAYLLLNAVIKNHQSLPCRDSPSWGLSASCLRSQLLQSEAIDRIFCFVRIA